MSKVYDESSILHLEPYAHIRKRPGMYVGALGDGKSASDGIYKLLKEVVDNSTDEFRMGHGKTVKITIQEDPLGTQVTIQDFGRGIPLGSVIDCVSKINTGGKYNSSVFQKSGGMNGVGIKAVNALSSKFYVESIRDGKKKAAKFEKGVIVEDCKVSKTQEKNGTSITFIPDLSIFGSYEYQFEHLEHMFTFFTCLNPGLTIEASFNGKIQTFKGEKGLLELMQILTKAESNGLSYPFINLDCEEDIQVVIAHSTNYGEEIYSFVNGQHTTDGGTHVAAFKEGFIKTIREFYEKSFESQDIRGGIVVAISIRIQEPLFESQTKIKLGSNYTEPPDPITGKPNGIALKSFFGEFLKENLDNFLHKNPETAKSLLAKIQQNETERKELSGIRDKARELTKKNSLNNKKLRDCRIHWRSNQKAHQERRAETTLFITEGDSAAGSITQVRDAEVQAVFTLRGKPFNCFGQSKKAIYENKELYMLQNAIGIDSGLEGLKYNKVVIATDADVDGMHIRLLIATFFLQYHIDLVKEGHLYVLQTPLFRVRNSKETRYCYSEQEKAKATQTLGTKVEITRFKGLGEISAKEFKNFINENIKLEPVLIGKNNIHEMLKFYMGDNTPDRQKYICEKLIEVTV